MKVKYQWRVVGREQKIMMEFLLLNEIDRQKWFMVTYLKLWRSFGLICIQ